MRSNAQSPSHHLGALHGLARHQRDGGLWQEAVLQNVELAGPSRVFLAEPAIAHDQELCVLAVDGGRLQLAAGRSLVMERLLMLDDEPEW